MQESGVDDALLSLARFLEETEENVLNRLNFVAVNFYLNGDVFDVVDELNGVRAEAIE